VGLCVLPKIAWERPWSAYLAEGRVFGVDPDKERIQLAWQTLSDIKNLRRKCCELQWNGIEGLRHYIQQRSPPLDNWETKSLQEHV